MLKSAVQEERLICWYVIIYRQDKLKLSEDLTIVPLGRYLPEKSVTKIFH